MFFNIILSMVKNNIVWQPVNSRTFSKACVPQRYGRHLSYLRVQKYSMYIIIHRSEVIMRGFYLFRTHFFFTHYVPFPTSDPMQPNGPYQKVGNVEQR